MIFEIPPPSIADQVNLNTVLIAFIAALVTLLTPAITVWATIQTRKADRAEDRADRAVVAMKVQEAAVKVEQVATAAKGNTEKIERIEKTGEATHKLVNNQRTEMLRTFSVQLRVAANDHPKDTALAKAAENAEKALAQNEVDNADPATKPGGATGQPIRVEVVNAEPVQVDQVEKK